MPESEQRQGWIKQTTRLPEGDFATFETQRKRRKMTRSAAMAEALREWSQRQAAKGTEAELVAPALEQLLDRRLSHIEDRLVKLLVKNGVLSTTAVELFLEQRRRNGHDTNALLRDIRPRVYRRWKDPANFLDTDPGTEGGDGTE